MKEKEEMDSGARMLGSDSHSATDHYVTLGKALNFPELCFPVCKTVSNTPSVLGPL